MALPRDYFSRQLYAQLHKSVPLTEGQARTAARQPSSDPGKDLTSIDGQTALQHLTNIIAAHKDYAEKTAAFHRAGDELQQTSHLLLEAQKAASLSKSAKAYDHLAEAVKLHEKCHKAFAVAKALHKEHHTAHHDTVIKCVKGLAKVLGGGPASAFDSIVEPEPSRLSTVSPTAKAAVGAFTKALRNAGINVQTRQRANNTSPFFKGLNWGQFGAADLERFKNDRGAGLEKGK
jgi:hypothetical protein